ncbi:ketopantoate reductase family protein [Aliiglaciecola aliphaticivorans]
MMTILGNGAIGNLLALQCHKLHLDYCILARSQAPTELLCRAIEQTTQSHHSQPSFSTATALHPVYHQETDSIDDGLFILPLKAYQIIPAIEQYKAKLSPEVPVALLHNGMVDQQHILQLLPSNPIIVATTSYGGFKPQPNKLNITGIGATQAGWLRNSIDNPYFQSIFEKLLPPCTWHSDISLILWRKLAVNAVINPLTAIYNIPNGALAQPQYHNTIMAINAEICTLMNRLEMPVTEQQLLSNCMSIIDKTAANYSSMHQDVLHNRKTEIENINGYVVSQGKILSIPTPINSHLLEQVRKIETYSGKK